MATSYSEAVEQTIVAGEQLHQIINGTATTEITVEDGSAIPTIRKALVDNFYFKDPLDWDEGVSEVVFNQLRKFTDGSWWYAPDAAISNPVLMGSTPIGDPLWRVFSLDAISKLNPQIRESLRRSYAEAGYNLVDGSFEAGGTLVNANDVLLHETTGKGYTGPAGPVAAGTNPATSGFVDRSNALAKISHTSVVGMAENYSLVVGNRVETASYNAHGIMNWEIVATSSNDSHYVPLDNGLFAKLLIGANVDPICFGAFNTINELTGAAGGYSDAAFAEAQSVAKLTKKPVRHSAGIYRLAGDYIIKVKTTGVCVDDCIVIFDDGFGFKTFTGAFTVSLVRYFIPEISDITFQSDKEPYWNATDAGAAYVPGILKYLVRLKYGQRVAKGNKTTTPNNILALDPQEQQAGTGFWNKDYTQWTQTAGEVNISDIPLFSTQDCCQLYTNDYRKVISRCNFVGFERGLVLAGTTQLAVSDCAFTTCRIGLNATDASYVGASSAAKTTTLDASRNLFEDTDIGIYAQVMLQSKVRDTNVFQPCRVGVYVGDGGCAGSRISGNYFEIGHTFFYHKPNLPLRGEVADNFTNTAYARYLGWCNNGSDLRFSEPHGGQTVRMNAGVQKSEISSGFLLDVDSNFFVENENIIDGGKAKQCIIRTVGAAGTSFSIAKLWSSVNTKGGTPLTPGFTVSQSGIVVNPTDTSRVINIELMDVSSTYSYFDANGTSPETRATYFFRGADNVAIDLRAAGVTHTIKVTWMEK